MDKFPLIAKSKICGDLIEFVLNSTDERLVEDIIIYDVKVSNLFNAPIEVCHSNHIYYSTTAQISDVRVCIVNVLLQPDWNFTLSFSKYGTRPVTVYSRANSKKTIVFNKNIRYGAPAVKRS
jgi:hypothetical protein